MMPNQTPKFGDNIFRGTFRSLFGVLMFVAASHAHAEGRCPDGCFPIGGGNAGWEGCAPMGGSEEPSGPEWSTRWGAIATASDVGAYGFSYSQGSKRAAEKKALSQCKKNSGGKTCKLRHTYHDQCAALAWGEEGNDVASAAELKDAERLALGACTKWTGGCAIEYSGCSYPERVD